MESILANISIMLMPALLAITVHEVSHGFIADKLGDPTARLLGRLTFNPIKHLDPVGIVSIFVFGFGWGRPVPVNFNNMQAPKRGMVAVALAGPVSSLGLALFFALILRALSSLPPEIMANWGKLVLEPLRLMAAFGLYVNVIMMVLNLIPFPPFDGGRVLIGLLPDDKAATLARFEPFGFILVMIVIFFTNIWHNFISPIVLAIVAFLADDQVLAVEQAIHFLFGQR